MKKLSDPRPMLLLTPPVPAANRPGSGGCRTREDVRGDLEIELAPISQAWV